MNIGSEEILHINKEELQYARKQMGNKKAPGSNTVLVKIIKEVEDILLEKNLGCIQQNTSYYIM